jgi:hypothetical protein
MPADTIDHIPPRAVRATILSQGLGARFPFLEVNACRECNGLLSNLTLWTTAVRKVHIKKRLRQRYAKYLRMPAWTDSELAEYDRRSTLGSHIWRGVIIKSITKQRLAW